MAFPGSFFWYISSAKYAAVTVWATGQAKSVGDLIRQSGSPSVGNERVWVCVVAGTTGGGADPLTTFTRGVKITDNTVTWQEFTGLPAGNGDLTNTPTWTVGAKNTAITLGHVIKSDNGQITLICDTAGTAGNGAEPTWSTTLGGTTADNTVTWRTLKISGNTFANWAAPHGRANNALATNWGDQVPSTFYWGNTTAETQSTNLTITARGTTANPNNWLCVDEAGSVPPVAADLTTGASITTSGSTTLAVQGALRWVYGIEFIGGSAATSADIVPCNDNLDKFYENCTFRLAGTSASASVLKGIANSARTRYKDCTLRFAATGQAMDPAGWMEFDNLSISASGSSPAILIGQALVSGNNSCVWIFRGCDLSLVTGTICHLQNLRVNEFVFEDCKIANGTALFNNTSTVTIADSHATFIRCNNLAGASDYDYSFADATGSQVVVTNPVRTGGAQSVSGTKFSWKLSCNANANAGPFSLETSRTGLYNSTLASRTLTAYGIANMPAMPTNIEFWMVAQYLSASNNSQGTQKTSRGSLWPGEATALTADTSAWDTAATARANTHAYALGDIIKLSSNPDRLFFCTTAGTSAGSEPGGYASAVDGDTVTDNTAVFRAGWRFKTTVTLTSPDPAQAGNVNAWFYMGPESAQTIYVDPKVAVS